MGLTIDGGALEILDTNGNELIAFVATASAVNGIRVVNAATGAFPIITNEGEADTGITFAGYDGTNTEEILELDFIASAVNGWKMLNAASGSAPVLGSNGTGAGANIGWELVDSNGNEVIEAVATASAVNGIRIVNNSTGLNPIITNEGEADTGITIAGYDGSNTEEIVIFDTVASAINELTITNAASGAHPSIAATGGGTNINITLTPKGTGIVNASAGGLATKQSVANVNDTTPTDAELDSAFGEPATLARGFIGTIDDADGDTNGYLVFCSDASWYFLKFTKAT